MHNKEPKILIDVTQTITNHARYMSDLRHVSVW